MNNENTYGYVYILVSDKTPYIKIGGTDYLPEKRCKEINTQPPYCLYAPWRVADYRSVPDWHNVETWLHYLFAILACGLLQIRKSYLMSRLNWLPIILPALINNR
ncbi:T5orf172 domain [Klebsiella pneumoniae subsp. pneumoniae]|nr:T5orf172 domain [Klebsiella pneumoniae subsp. pneumoniae]